MKSIYLSEEHLLLQKMIRDFSANEIKPLAYEIDEKSIFPIKSIKS